MIAKVRKGSGFRRLLRYVFAEAGHEGRDDPRRIGGNTLGADAHALSREFQEFADQAPHILRPVWHASLRTSPQDRILTDAEWANAAHVFMRNMGMVGTGFDASDVPYAVVRHAEDHIHIVAARIRFDGRTWHDARDYYRSHHAARAAERELGLVDASLVRGREMSTVTKSERARAARNGVEPERVQLRRLVEHARDMSDGTQSGFESALTGAGVLFRANVASTGRMSGYSFSLPSWVDGTGRGVWLPASKVSRELRWSQLSRDLEVVQERYVGHTRHREPWTRSADADSNLYDRSR